MCVCVCVCVCVRACVRACVCGVSVHLSVYNYHNHIEAMDLHVYHNPQYIISHYIQLLELETCHYKGPQHNNRIHCGYYPVNITGALCIYGWSSLIMNKFNAHIR